MNGPCLAWQRPNKSDPIGLLGSKSIKHAETRVQRMTDEYGSRRLADDFGRFNWQTSPMYSSPDAHIFLF